MVLAFNLTAIQAFHVPARVSTTTTTGTAPRMRRGFSSFQHSPTITRNPIAPTTRLPTKAATSATQLRAFLPPSGGGNRRSGLGPVVTAVLTLVGVTAFFFSPLGAIFFGLVNSLILLSILIPVFGFVAFQIWTYFNTITAPCPNCAAPVTVTKDGAPSFCFNCGAIVQARGDDQIYLANLGNRGGVFAEEEEDDVVSAWFDELGGVHRSPPGGTRATKTTRTTTIIDVDVEDDK